MSENNFKLKLNSKLKSIKSKVRVDADTTQAEKKIKKIGKQKTDAAITPTVDTTQVVSGLKKAQKETKTLWERFTANIFGSNLIRMGMQNYIPVLYRQPQVLLNFWIRQTFKPGHHILSKNVPALFHRH